MNGFRLTLTRYSGDTGNSMDHNNGRRFTTYDRDQDDNHTRKCAFDYRGGWWYGLCTIANLNGPYTPAGSNGITTICWYDWGNNHNALQHTEKKIRPVT